MKSVAVPIFIIAAWTGSILCGVEEGLFGLGLQSKVSLVSVYIIWDIARNRPGGWAGW